MKIRVRTGNVDSSVMALLALVIAFALFWYLSVYKPNVTNSPTPYPETNHRVVAFGGSLTAGLGALQGASYVDILEQRLQTEIIESSRPLERITSSWPRLEDALQHNPRIVILELGYDDSLFPQTDPDIFSSRLERIIQTIHESGSAVILLETPGYGYIYRRISREYNTALVPNLMEGMLGNQEYMFDERNPNDTGYRLMADRIEPVLLKLLQK